MKNEIEKEIFRLKAAGLGKFCLEGDFRVKAGLTLEINRLKKERDAAICVHVYQRPEVILGVGDFVGDSYKLAADSRKTAAERIIFCGVHFMAETAKILNPGKKVYIPDPQAGCSLSESVTPADIRRLKKKHPGAPVATYINTSAAVKAESDVIVTSANAERILVRLFEKSGKVIFLPDRFMGANLARKLNKRIGEEIILWNGSCLVHERFDAGIIKSYRKKYPNMLVLAHAECPSEIIKEVDFMGGTGDMMEYIAKTGASAYMLVTECGFGELARMRYPGKNFIAMCRLCPYMKMITLENILQTLKNPGKAREVLVSPETAAKAARALEKMFELAE